MFMTSTELVDVVRIYLPAHFRVCQSLSNSTPQYTDVQRHMAFSALQVKWKLTRGSWRPKLLAYAQEHSEAAVKEATTRAFQKASAHQAIAWLLPGSAVQYVQCIFSSDG
jgi:hypothetical protein